MAIWRYYIDYVVRESSVKNSEIVDRSARRAISIELLTCVWLETFHCARTTWRL